MEQGIYSGSRLGNYNGRRLSRLDGMRSGCLIADEWNYPIYDGRFGSVILDGINDIITFNSYPQSTWRATFECLFTPTKMTEGAGVNALFGSGSTMQSVYFTNNGVAIGMRISSNNPVVNLKRPLEAEKTYHVIVVAYSEASWISNIDSAMEVWVNGEFQGTALGGVGLGSGFLINTSLNRIANAGSPSVWFGGKFHFARFYREYAMSKDEIINQWNDGRLNSYLKVPTTNVGGTSPTLAGFNWEAINAGFDPISGLAFSLQNGAYIEGNPP